MNSGTEAVRLVQYRHIPVILTPTPVTVPREIRGCVDLTPNEYEPLSSLVKKGARARIFTVLPAAPGGTGSPSGSGRWHSIFGLKERVV